MPLQPFFSIIIPSYNHDQFVCEAIDSVLNQTFKDFEIIVVDDGSTDETRKKISTYLNPDVRYIYQNNKGLPGARNTGIKNSKGRWIALLDADDLWHPQRLAHIKEHIMRYVDVQVFGSSEPHPDNIPLAKDLPCNPPVRRLAVKDFLFQGPFAPSAAVIEARCFDKIGLFTESLKSAEDREMWLRLASQFNVMQIQSDSWIYRFHGDQMSSNCPRMFKYYKIVLDRFFLPDNEHSSYKKAAYSYLYMDAAICAILHTSKSKGIGYLLTSCVLHPAALPYSQYPRFQRTKLFFHTILGSRVTRSVKKAAYLLRQRTTASA